MHLKNVTVTCLATETQSLIKQCVFHMTWFVWSLIPHLSCKQYLQGLKEIYTKKKKKNLSSLPGWPLIQAQYLSRQGCRCCTFANKNPRFRNVPCETSDYYYPGLIVNTRWNMSNVKQNKPGFLLTRVFSDSGFNLFKWKERKKQPLCVFVDNWLGRIESQNTEHSLTLCTVS